MRRLFILILLLLPLSLLAQTAKEEILSDPYKAGGCYYMYQFSQPSHTAAPKGYKAFYLSHYGRHGARYVTKDKMPLELMEVMDSAYAAGAFTDFGSEFYARLQKHFSKVIYRSGDLSQLGWQQHNRIAKQIYKEYPSIFKKSPSIYAYATQSQRCIMSMNSFCLSLKEMDSRLDITEDTSRSFLPELNPHASENPWFDDSVKHYYSPDSDPWGGSKAQFAARNYDPGTICARFFKDPHFPDGIGGQSSFVSNLYHIVMDVQCLEDASSLLDAFTPEELYGIWRTNNYKTFLENGPLQFRDISLLENIVTRTDEDLAGGYDVRLRFGHDMDLIPILCFIEADGWNVIPDSPDKIEDTFRTYWITMATTLYFVFYKNKASDVLFKAVLNGKELHFNALDAVEGPYYKWSDFRDFCVDKIERVKSQTYPDETTI